MLKYLVESILTTKKYFFRSFFQKQPGFPLKASQNNQLPLFALKAGYRTIPLTAERPKLFLHTVLYPRSHVVNRIHIPERDQEFNAIFHNECAY